MVYMVRVVRQRSHITKAMVNMTQDDIFCIVDFKYKGRCEHHGTSQAFYLSKIRIYIHVISIIRLKTNVPNEVLSEARTNLRNINNWV